MRARSKFRLLVLKLLDWFLGSFVLSPLAAKYLEAVGSSVGEFFRNQEQMVS